MSGMVDKVAHLPEIRFAIGEPGLDTTSIDNAATSLERKGFYLRKIGKDGFRFGFQPTLKKVVGDRRASLDDAEVKRELRRTVQEEWERRATLPLALFPELGTSVLDQPRLEAVLHPLRLQLGRCPSPRECWALALDRAVAGLRKQQ